jgi:hypothetical protein
MENIKTMGHVFRHPKYYEELRKSRKQDILPRGNMSPDSEEKRQASSDKRQAIEETVPHCDIEEAATTNHINKKEKNE